MKCTGLVAVALAAVMTVACGDGARDEANDANNAPGTTVGTGGEIGENREISPAEDNRAGAPRDVQQFVREAAMHGTAEVELGRIAAERGASAEIKQFGEMMVSDHTKANNELKAAVGAHSIQIPQEMDEKHRDLAQRLRGLSGAEFDREYMNAMVDGHQDVKNLLEERADEANDNRAPGAADADSAAEMAVNQWAAKTLPSVEQHLQRAEQIRDRLDNSRRNTTQ
jgi:putative membrane protein